MSHILFVIFAIQNFEKRSKGMILNLLNIALEKGIVISSIKVAIVVGCILNLINQGDIFFNLNFERVNWFKVGLTFCVPYMVSTYASVRVKVVSD